MKEFWIIIQTVFTGLGGWIGYYLGGCDGLKPLILLEFRGNMSHGKRSCS